MPMITTKQRAVNIQLIKNSIAPIKILNAFILILLQVDPIYPDRFHHLLAQA